MPAIDPDELEASVRFLRRQPQVGAMRLDPRNRVIALATIGEVDLEKLRASLQTTLESLERDFARSGPQKPRPALEGVEIVHSGEGTLLQRKGCPTAPSLWQWREFPWFETEPPAVEEKKEEWRELRRDAALSGGLLLLGFLVQQAGFFALSAPWFVPAIYALASFFGGRDAAVDAWAKLREGSLDIHFLMLAVALGAAFVGAWGEGALLLFLFSASGAMEAFVSHRTRREIESLLKAAPRHATRLRADGSEEEVDSGELIEDDSILIRPGTLFPADAEITRGETAADESALTGESLPVDKGVGDLVYSGTLNTWGSVTARVVRPVGQSALQKIIDLIRNAQQRKAPAQRFTDRFGTGYTWLVLSLTVLMFFVWWLGFGIDPFSNGEDGTYSAFYRAMALLVVMSPCALVLSIPSAILAAIAAGARQGVLFRGGAAVEKLAGVTLVALDKTGTLTSGELVVDEIMSIPPGQEEEVAAIACSIERHATHPVARAIVRYGRKEGIPFREVHDFQTHTGLGVSARDNGALCVLGRRAWIGRESSEGGLGDLVAKVPMAEAACIEVWVLRGNLLGRILLRDRVRCESRGVLSDLRALGIKPRMLTGDRLQVARQVGAEVGLLPEEILADLLPEGKVTALQEYKRAGENVAMVGDGINDAPSLAEADVAIGMGARGSDAALEQSDVVLMNDRIELFVQAYKLSRLARTVIRQNLAISFGTVVIMAIVALGGRIPLSLGVLAHEGSTVLVCLNGLRLLLASGRVVVPTAREKAPAAVVLE